MSSNLLKSYFVSPDAEGARVINTNDMIAQKLERIRMVLPDVNLDGFQAVNLAEGSDVVDPLDALTSEFAEEGFTGGLSAPEVVPEPVYTGPSPEELVAQAQVEIEAMKRQAMDEIAIEKQIALQSAREEGYEDGKRQAMQELEVMRGQIEQERHALRAAYEEQIEQLEPEFVRTLTGIYEKVFEVGLDNQSEIVLSLLRNTMRKLDGCKNFLLHVSAADYSYIKEHKAELMTDSTQEGTVIDIIEDSMIREGECTIETVNGIYDCGIGTHLEGLRKKLILLSYNGQQES